MGSYNTEENTISLVFSAVNCLDIIGVTGWLTLIADYLLNLDQDGGLRRPSCLYEG